ELDRDVARLRAHEQLAEHDADLAAVDRAFRLADELERDLRAHFLVRIDREQVDVRDLATRRVHLIVLDARVQVAAALDRQVDDGVLLANRIERGAKRLDVDRDRERLDAPVDRGAVADSGDLALRAQLAGRTLAGLVANRDCELPDFHGRFPSPGRPNAID